MSDGLERRRQSWTVDTTIHYCWEVKSSLKLVWMESSQSNSPCNSLTGHSFKWRWCSLVRPISFLTKPVLTLQKEINRLLDCQLRVRSHAPSIWSPRGTKVVWPDSQPMRVPGCLHWSIPSKSSFFLPAFEISRSCRTASEWEGLFGLPLAACGSNNTVEPYRGYWRKPRSPVS
jgi:hypothetical protein